MIPWLNMGDLPTWLDVRKVEQTFTAKTGGRVRHIGALTIMTKSGWSEQPVEVFWQERPEKPEHSNYFGLFKNDGGLMICNADSVAEGIWVGVSDPTTGETIFSRFRHDYRTTSTGCMTDGGRDYSRSNGKGGSIWVKIEGPTPRVYHPATLSERERDRLRQSKYEAQTR